MIDREKSRRIGIQKKRRVEEKNEAEREKKKKKKNIKKLVCSKAN